MTDDKAAAGTHSAAGVTPPQKIPAMAITSNRHGYRGVWWDAGARRWRAEIWADGVRRLLGVFESAEAAARGYDDAARKIYGADARLNFPRPGEHATQPAGDQFHCWQGHERAAGETCSICQRDATRRYRARKAARGQT